MLKFEIGGFEIRVSFWLCAFAAAALSIQSGGALLAYSCAAALHEGAHIACLALSGARARSLTLALGKLELDASVEGLPLLPALASLLGGAALNLLLAAVLFSLGGGVFARANLFLGALNLLPAAHLDGGRALALVFERLLPERAARRALRALSFACGVIICALGFLAVLRGSRNPTAPLFGVYIIIGTLKSRE